MTSSRGSPSAVDRRRALRSPSRSRSPTIVRPTSIAFLPPTDSRSPPTETCNRATRRRRQQRRRHRDAHGRRRFAPSRRSLTSLGWGVNSRWLEGGKHDGGRSRTPFGIVFRRGVREARATREEKLRGRLEGRRCRRAATAAYRFYSPPPPAPDTLRSHSHSDRGRATRWGAFSGGAHAASPPRRVHWNSVPSERCNALSSLPDSASERRGRFPLPRRAPRAARRQEGQWWPIPAINGGTIQGQILCPRCWGWLASDETLVLRLNLILERGYATNAGNNLDLALGRSSELVVGDIAF